MFSPVYVGSRAKQPFTFLASLGLQGVLVALLCLMPKAQGPCLRMDTLHTDELRSELVTPLYFLDHITQAPSVAKPGSRASRPTLQDASIPELPSGQMDAVKMMEDLAKQAEASPNEPQAEAQPVEEAAVAEAGASGESEGGLVPFARWQMNSGSNGYGFVHHQIKGALAVFTPDPPILHGEFPEPARGKEVVMNVVINEEGTIVAVKVLQGIGFGVENSIVETLRRWIYVPAKVNGRAIASQKELRFRFPG